MMEELAGLASSEASPWLADDQPWSPLHKVVPLCTSTPGVFLFL